MNLLNSFGVTKIVKKFSVWFNKFLNESLQFINIYANWRSFYNLDDVVFSTFCIPLGKLSLFIYLCHCQNLRGSVLNCEQVSEWYRQRACEIELLSGKVEDALEMIKLGIEHQVEVNCSAFYSLLCVQSTVPWKRWFHNKCTSFQFRM